MARLLCRSTPRRGYIDYFEPAPVQIYPSLVRAPALLFLLILLLLPCFHHNVLALTLILTLILTLARALTLTLTLASCSCSYSYSYSYSYSRSYFRSHSYSYPYPLLVTRYSLLSLRACMDMLHDFVCCLIPCVLSRSRCLACLKLEAWS